MTEADEEASRQQNGTSVEQKQGQLGHGDISQFIFSVFPAAGPLELWRFSVSDLFPMASVFDVPRQFSYP